jgi:predicted peptidase
MRRPFALAAPLVLLLCSCAATDAWHLGPGQAPQQFTRELRIPVSGRLQLYLPRGFEARAGVRWPLVVFLHGSGEAGEDVSRVLANGPPRLAAGGAEFPFILASPQTPYGETRGFDPWMLDALLDELESRLPVDPDRVYVTGLSLGGMWSYGYASHRPDRVAAIVPVSGLWDAGDACRLKGVPVWAFHGGRDDVVPLARDREMVDAVNACGGRARLTVYEDAGHDAWSRAYADPELWRWLLAQRRQKPTQADR